MENLYIEVYYVQRAISFNIAKVTRIENSYSLFTNKYSEFITEVDINTKLLRMRHQVKNLVLKIEMRYIIESEVNNKTAEKSLRKLGQNNSTVSDNYLLTIGWVIGLIVTVFTVVMVFKD